MECRRCGKKLTGEQVYTAKGKPMCEDCAMHVGLFPLGHTGPHKKLFYIRDRKGR